VSAAPRAKALPGWLLDELVTVGRENLDPDHVARYDDKEDAGALEEVRVLMDFGLTAQPKVIDLGAGTGQFSLTVADHCSRVTAVEVSPQMLARLISKVRASGRSNIDVVKGGFLTYEHSGPLVDFVYSRWALHHLPPDRPLKTGNRDLSDGIPALIDRGRGLA
jgi:SAM-dependent methyltransferase